MELAKLFIVWEPYEFLFCAPRTCSVLCLWLWGFQCTPQCLFHSLPDSFPGSQQPSQVSPAPTPDFSDVWPSHGTSFPSVAEGLCVDWRSLLCVQLLCHSLQKCFLSVCTPNASGSSSSLCIQIFFSVEDYSFYLSAGPLKKIQDG